MIFDLTPQLPAVFDILHLALAALSLILLLVVVLRSSKTEAPAVEVKTEEPKVEIPKTAPKPQAQLKEFDGEGALQLLSLLQQDGRIIDFIREDVAQYSDEEIGAAARVVHKGLRKTFDEHFTVEGIRSEEEGDTVVIEAGFKPQEIQLLGQVAGEGPYKGALVHQGWKVTDIKLPKVVEGRDSRILAAAQVEVGA